MLNFFKKKKNLKIKDSINSYKLSYKKYDNELNKLCKIYGCDKGIFTGSKKFFSWFPHNYTDIYDDLFFDKRLQFKKIFELGIGTNKVFNKRLERETKPGASLRVWKDYFPNASIFGGDIDSETMFNESRIKTFIVDQTNKESVKKMWSKLKLNDFDVIIDDGLHNFEAAKIFFDSSFKKLSSNGYYFIEDIFYKDFDKYLNYFSKKKLRISFFEIKNQVLQVDNNILMIRNLNC